jgi:FixJ family two-component response regulator
MVISRPWANAERVFYWISRLGRKIYSRYAAQLDTLESMADFTIFLVDDDPGVLQGLTWLLESAGYSTKSYASAKAFLDEHDGSIPGCVVLDLAMPELNGLKVQDALVRRHVNRPIVFLTGEATIPESVQAMKAGAMDFLTKPIKKSELLRAIETAKARDEAQRRIEAERDEVLQRMAKLTDREREVLDYVTKGWINKQIGSALGVNEKTIKLYRGRMYEKMGVRTVPDLVRMTTLASQENSERGKNY